MKKLRYLSIVALLALRPVSSPAQSGQLEHSLLWRISGNQLLKPSFMFGTLHVICEDDYLWTAKMRESLSASDMVCFEMNLADTSMLRALMASKQDTSSKTLGDYFTPQQFATVQQYFKDSLGQDITASMKKTPSMLQSAMRKKMYGCDKTTSYERQIMRTAMRNGKKILGLETLADAKKTNDALPPDRMVKSVLTMAKGGTRARAAYRMTVAIYKQQNLPMIDEMNKLSQSEVTEDVLLDSRNKKWLELMPAMMDSASVFFAVGAGHLPGDDGLIDLLRKAGYTVEALTDTVNLRDRAKQQEAMLSPDMAKPDYNLNAYFKENVHYPELARKNHVAGKVYVKFVVNTDGTISDCTVLKGIGSGCDEEAVRVITNMPAWQPGTQNGRPVKVRYNQAISFMLD
jgi:TonB family protein